MNSRAAAAAVVGVMALAAFVVYAPVVPFERLVSISAPSSPSMCTSPVSPCSMEMAQVWLRSYGSFTYVFFGFGTAPFTTPVTVDVNGATAVFQFNGTSIEEELMYPSYARPEPLGLITPVRLAIYSIPFGGHGINLTLMNNGSNETAYLVAYLGSAGETPTGLSYPSQVVVAAGSSATVRVMWWTSGVPSVGSSLPVTVLGVVCYSRPYNVCFQYQRTFYEPLEKAGST